MKKTVAALGKVLENNQGNKPAFIKSNRSKIRLTSLSFSILIVAAPTSVLGKISPSTTSKWSNQFCLRGIKQSDEDFFIFQDGRQISAFVVVANGTGVSEIFEGGLPAVFPADDVV